MPNKAKAASRRKMEHSVLRIEKAVLDAVVAHAGKEIAIEACGYLADMDGVVRKHYELTNIDRSPRHFSMAPEEQFAAVKDMRKHGLRIRAVYHSHPENPAIPSLEDIRLAYDPDISYVIISMLAGEDEPVRSFRISQGDVRQEPIKIIATGPHTPIAEEDYASSPSSKYCT